MTTISKILVLINMLFASIVLISDAVKCFKYKGFHDIRNQLTILTALSISQLLILINLFV